ncbi:MAG: ABC transporter ATP-binding protein [Anaerolineae bacterium]|nr:ABC transporter ATP-binding protein [Anaerolineae bacterium]
MIAAVQVENLHKHFGGLHVLRGLSLTVRAGEIYGLLGPNGAGKSTLIRSMMGLIQPGAGQITVLGQRMPQKRVLAQVGYMTQATALYPDLTVYQNVAFFAGLMGYNDRSAILEALALVDLADRAYSRVATLSGGMKQRVSLASVLVHRPRLILLDEPTVGVDPQLRVQFWEHFRRLTEGGVTLIVSSHVMDEAERCTRLGFIRAGQVLIEGTAADIRAQAGTANLEEAFLHFAAQHALPSQ